jgi:outer membrane receptor for ferrienterochelin and colicins
MMTRPTAMAIGVFLLVPALAAGQNQRPPADVTEMSLEQLMQVDVERVYGASKFLQEVTNAPASITIIKSREIEEHGYRTLADVLRNVRGFYVTYDRNYSYVGVRGFARPGDYNTRILVLVDGHRLNDNIYDQMPVGTEFPLDLALVERIEVIRGPSSSIYGTSAFFAVVNVITKSAAALPRVNVEATVGTLGTRASRVTLATRRPGGFNLLFSASAYGSRQERHLYFPEFATPETNNGYADNADGDQSRQLFANVTFGDFTVQGAYSSRDKQVPTASYGTTFNDPSARTIDARGYVDARYARSFGAATKLLFRVSYDRYRYTGDYPYASWGDLGPVMERDFGRGDWIGTEAMVTRTLGRRHTLTGGVEYRYNIKQDQQTYLDQPRVNLLDDRRTSNDSALYIQDEFLIHKKLTLNAGIRHDQSSLFEGSTNARVGLILRLSAASTLKVLHGGAFRAPNAYELFYNSGGTRADLRPETIQTDEIVWEAYWGSHLRTSAAAFQYRIQRLINQRTDNEDALTPGYVNLGGAHAAGGEVEIEGIWERFHARVSQTLERAADADTGVSLTNMPRQLTNVNLSVPVTKRLVVAYDGQYVSERRTLAWDVVPGYYLQNITVTLRKVAGGVSFSGGVNNLGNIRYWDPAAEEHIQDRLQQNGRTAWVKALWSF